MTVFDSSDASTLDVEGEDVTDDRKRRVGVLEFSATYILTTILKRVRTATAPKASQSAVTLPPPLPMACIQPTPTLVRGLVSQAIASRCQAILLRCTE